MTLVKPVVNVVSASITSIIASILCAILLVLHCYKYYKHEISSESTSSINKLSKSPQSFAPKLMFILTILSMTLFTISLLTAPIAYYVCNTRFRQFTDLSYHLAIGIMHLVLIMRLHLVFQNSKYKYKLKTLIIWAICIIITYGGPNILGWFITSLLKDEIILFGETIIVCINIYPNTGVINYMRVVVASINIVMDITIPIAFVYPLTKIMKSLKQDYNINQHVHNDQELKKPIIKSTILTLIIVIVSLLAYSIMGLFRFVAIWSIHAVLNCLCIILITPYHDKLYKILCCAILKWISFVQMKHDEMEKVAVTIDIKNHNQTDDNDIMSKDVEETLYDTRTLATLPQENIKYENQSEYTQTVQIEMYSTQ